MYMLLQWKRKHHLLGIVILMQNLLWTVCWVHKVCEFWHHILQFASCFLPEVNIETLVTDQMSEFIKSLLYCVLSVYMWGKDASEADNLDKWDLILDFPSYLHFIFLFPFFFFFQNLYGMQHLSTRSPPTSTSPPYRQSSPLISPSTSRLALLQECFWRTWASRTSSEWSSAVSQQE